jgi:hypothetical protein
MAAMTVHIGVFITFRDCSSVQDLWPSPTTTTALKNVFTQLELIEGNI